MRRKKSHFIGQDTFWVAEQRKYFMQNVQHIINYTGILLIYQGTVKFIDRYKININSQKTDAQTSSHKTSKNHIKHILAKTSQSVADTRSAFRYSKVRTSDVIFNSLDILTFKCSI